MTGEAWSSIYGEKTKSEGVWMLCFLGCGDYQSGYGSGFAYEDRVRSVLATPAVAASDAPTNHKPNSEISPYL